jgi:hypothetical protein
MEDILIHCADKDCTGSNCDLVGKLQIIGNGLHCPYCRGIVFTLDPTEEAKERQKQQFKQRKKEAQKRRDDEKNARDNM